MTPTAAETAINHATAEDLGGARIFYRGGSGLPQFRVTKTEGGYFMEHALAGGRHWEARAYQLADSGLNADNIPAAVWNDRSAWAKEQAAAIAVLRAHKIDPGSPVADYENDPDADAEVRRAGRTLRGLQYLLVWPADVVAEHIDAYQRQWNEVEE